MKADRAKPDRLDRAAFGGLLLLLLWLPLPWGSHRPWAGHLFVLLAGLLLALAAAGLAAKRRPLPRRLYAAAGLWLAWLLWISLQLLPLPPAWLQALSPASAAIHAAAGRASGAAPLDTISVAPGQGVDALLLSLGYFSLYLLAALTVRDRGRRRAVMLALVIAGLLQAVYGSLMTLSGEEYGFLGKKVFYLGYATGTFVNRNHLAAYLGLAAAVGLGLVLADLGPATEGRGWRARLAGLVELALSTKLRVRVAIAMMIIALVLTRSRMGNTAFFAALGVVGLAQLLLRERRLLPRAVLLFASLVLIDTLIVSHWFGLGKVVERIETTEVQTEMRAQVWQRLPPMVDTYAATGSGLGSFAVAFPPFRTPDIVEYYDHAHDDYLEFLIETGVPGLALLALLVLCHVLHALKVAWRRHDRLLQGLAFSYLMGSLALAVHATVEFNFQIPAIAATYVALMGMIAACSGEPQSGDLAAAAAAGTEPPDRRASSPLPSGVLPDSV